MIPVPAEAEKNTSSVTGNNSRACRPLKVIDKSLTRFAHGLSLFRTNPALFFRRVYTEIKGPSFLRRLPVQKRIHGVVFEFDFAADPSIKLMFAEIYEADIVNTMRKYLHAGEVFFDVGANIGYLSAVALGLVGRSGQVHSFEPVPRFFDRLKLVADFNPEYAMKAHQCALGESDGAAVMNISNVSNIGWNTMVPGMMSPATILESITVPVTTLSSYIRKANVERVGMIKIDTEGYEYPVVKGLQAYFDQTPHRPVLLIEIAPSAYPLMGSTLREFRQHMNRVGYSAFDVHNHHCPVDVPSLTETTNVLFLPSI